MSDDYFLKSVLNSPDFDDSRLRHSLSLALQWLIRFSRSLDRNEIFPSGNNFVFKESTSINPSNTTLINVSREKSVINIKASKER